MDKRTRSCNGTFMVTIIHSLSADNDDGMLMMIRDDANV